MLGKNWARKVGVGRGCCEFHGRGKKPCRTDNHIDPISKRAKHSTNLTPTIRQNINPYLTPNSMVLQVLSKRLIQSHTALLTSTGTILSTNWASKQIVVISPAQTLVFGLHLQALRQISEKEVTRQLHTTDPTVGERIYTCLRKPLYKRLFWRRRKGSGLRRA